ncbi:MAG: DUF4162 domain-containing protein, partial [Exilispira sp.]|nr:DUF4162 domain-containing protein [Exilispira sp.]
KWVEIELKDDVTPNQALAFLIDKISINKFEIVNPSLHSIFVKLVKEDESEL